MYGGSSKVKGALTTPASVRRAVYGGGCSVPVPRRPPASDRWWDTLPGYVHGLRTAFLHTYLPTYGPAYHAYFTGALSASKHVVEKRKVG